MEAFRNERAKAADSWIAESDIAEWPVVDMRISIDWVAWRTKIKDIPLGDLIFPREGTGLDALPKIAEIVAFQVNMTAERIMQLPMKGMC